LGAFKEPRPLQQAIPKDNGDRILNGLEALARNLFLVPEGFDERSLTRDVLAQREADLTSGKLISCLQLCISDRCNINCTYCFANRSDEGSARRRELVHHPKKLMSYEMASQALDKFLAIARRHGKQRFIVKFFGREPLLNWRVIFQLMENYDQGGSDGLPIRWDLTTNGIMINQEVAKGLKKHDALVFVSVDSVAEANDLTRVKGAHGKTFAEIDQGISFLRRNGVKTVFSAVVSSTNFDQFDQRVIDYATSYEVETVVMLLAMQNDDLACQRTRGTEEICRKLSQVYWYGKSRGVDVRGYWHNPLRRLLTLKSAEFLAEDPGREDLASCPATGFQIAMEPSGDLFPCRAQSHHLGHIDQLEQSLASEAYRQQAMRTYYNVEACKGCSLEGMCQGVCLGHSEYAFDDIYQPDERYCQVYRKVTPMILLDA
jgi:uncharacterized protein